MIPERVHAKAMEMYFGIQVSLQHIIYHSLSFTSIRLSANVPSVTVCLRDKNRMSDTGVGFRRNAAEGFEV